MQSVASYGHTMRSSRTRHKTSQPGRMQRRGHAERGARRKLARAGQTGLPYPAMRPFLFFAIAMGLTTAGCESQRHTRTVNAALPAKSTFVFFQLEGGNGYLIDPRTETCFLRQESSADYDFALVPVPCDKLKRNVPEAAAHIRWVNAAPPTGREGVPAAPPPASTPTHAPAP